MTTDKLNFLKEAPGAPEKRTASQPRRWKVVIADDEPEMHHVTRFALRHFMFEGAGLEFISAYSAAETMSTLRSHPDAAVLMLDVVMETETAGLDLVHRIREELGASKLRIMLRTGQPGKAPEADVIARFDINDYREKTDLTGQRLATALYSCLRSYRDIATIEAAKIGLETLVNASTSIFQRQTADQFAHDVVNQIDALLHSKEGGVCAPPAETDRRGNLLASCSQGETELHVMAATGAYAGTEGKPLSGVLERADLAFAQDQLARGENGRSGARYIGVYPNPTTAKLLFVNGCSRASGLDQSLLEAFSASVGVGFDTLRLRSALEESQREIAYRLSGAVETRSKETANHIRRVAEMSALIGRAYGLSEREAEVLRHAAPLHDVGKVGIPDHILNKPGRHTPEEWIIMKEHAQLGHEILSGSDHEILQIGGVIALEHHERWDGGGYPMNKAGEEISVEGRIVAAIDVFDALGSKRCYKDAWSKERILSLFQAERGRHFDPRIVDLIFERIDDLTAVRELYPDQA